LLVFEANYKNKLPLGKKVNDLAEYCSGIKQFSRLWPFFSSRSAQIKI